MTSDISGRGLAGGAGIATTAAVSWDRRKVERCIKMWGGSAIGEASSTCPSPGEGGEGESDALSLAEVQGLGAACEAGRSAFASDGGDALAEASQFSALALSAPPEGASDGNGKPVEAPGAKASTLGVSCRPSMVACELPRRAGRTPDAEVSAVPLEEATSEENRSGDFSEAGTRLTGTVSATIPAEPADFVVVVSRSARVVVERKRVAWLLAGFALSEDRLGGVDATGDTHEGDCWRA